MALPFLPGNSFNKCLGKTKYHKSHHFDVANETPMLVGEEKPGIGGEPLLGQKIRPKNSVFPRGEGSNLPTWVAFDRQVLSFDAYYQEAVHESRSEQYRVRNCKIYFYLEDDSIQVIEPRMKNAGVPQGTIIRRHRVPKPPPNDDQFYTVDDFNVGNTINLYAKVFKLTGCDLFTQNFLRKLGVKVGEFQHKPEDPYSSYRKAMDESMQPLRPYEKTDTLKQFLDHDRHVLRFFCFWDDTDSMFGDVRELVLHYFLADDTLEIREVIPPNSGRDSVPVFLRRGKLPKNVEQLMQPGTLTDRTVLNVFGPMGHGGRYILDNLKTGAVHIEYYKDSDLTLGTVLNVWGRKVILCDCDNFTKEYYRTKYGIEHFSPVEYRQRPAGGMERAWPPYNGFGSEEDSLCSCQALIPKPPRRDFIKFMEKDRCGLESNVLRFLAKMVTNKPIDRERKFIVSYFLCDDTIQVYEPPIRNSGIIGGKFLERGRVKKPNQERYGTQLSEYYLAQDMFIGAVVEFNKFQFMLIDADEYAFSYMEAHPSEFPVADVSRILPKVAATAGQNMEELRSFFNKNDKTGLGLVPYESFRQLLLTIQSNLNEHELITIARRYSEQKTPSAVDAKKVVAMCQEVLRKHNFESFERLSESFRHNDQAKTGYAEPSDILSVFHSQHVPLPDELLKAAMSLAPVNDQRAIHYDSLLQQMNWRDFPLPPLDTALPPQEEAWEGTQPRHQITQVNYQEFLLNLFGKKSQS